MDIELLKPCCFTQLGKRDSQEDNLYPTHTNTQTAFFVVCDGVGGREHGELASHLVCQTFEQNLSDEQCKVLRPNDILSLIEQSYHTLYNNRAICPSMATTLAFMAKTNEGMLLVHLGDSRIYQIRKGKGVIFQTKDHSLVNDLIDSGEITMDRAIDHPQRNVITKCIFVTGNRNDYQTPSITLIRDIQPHDIFMLCTDGVYSGFSNEKLSEILTSNESLEGKTKELADFCKNSCDNNTAYLVEVANVEERDDEEYNIQYTIDYGRQPICLHSLDFVREAASFIKETLCSKQHA